MVGQGSNGFRSMRLIMVWVDSKGGDNQGVDNERVENKGADNSGEDNNGVDISLGQHLVSSN